MVTQRKRKTTRPGRSGADATSSTAPTGGRAAKAAIRREQLLSTALALFSEHGYAATSTRSIAEAAGVTEGLVFHYFGSKDALLLELMSRQSTFAGRILALVQRAAGGTARELFSAVASGYADISVEEAKLVGLVTAEAHVNAPLRAQITAGNAFVNEGLVQILERRIAAGELREDAPLSAALLGFFGGFSFFYAQHRDVATPAWRREAAAFAQSWAEVCWRGIASVAALSEYSTRSEPNTEASPSGTKTRAARTSSTDAGTSSRNARKGKRP